MSLQLEFPFLVLSQAHVVFGGIPNYQEVIEACPGEFYKPNEWSDLASFIFSKGLNEDNWERMDFASEDVEVIKAQFAYCMAWLGSFKPPHEVKTAVCGWLFSLMLKSCPKFS